MRFYVSLLPGSKIEEVVTLDHPLGAGHDPIKVIEFTLSGTAYQAMEAGRNEPFADAMSISVLTDSQAETDRLWDALTAEGGSPVECGWLKDRWGMYWQIVPREMSRMMASPDKAAVNRAMTAMLSMKKLDAAALERAFRGD